MSLPSMYEKETTMWPGRLGVPATPCNGRMELVDETSPLSQADGADDENDQETIEFADEEK